MKQINVEKMDDVQLSLVLALQNNEGHYTHAITKQADEFYEWLKEKRKNVQEKEVVNETFNINSTGTNTTYLMHSFESDKKSSSKTKCKICGLERWQHPVITYT